MALSGKVGKVEACKRLGVEWGASASEIRRAYRKKAKLYHPDVVRGGATRKRDAERQFIRIREAYDALKDNSWRVEVVAKAPSSTSTTTSSTGRASWQKWKDERAKTQEQRQQRERWLMILLLSWPMSYIITGAVLIINRKSGAM